MPNLNSIASVPDYNSLGKKELEPMNIYYDKKHENTVSYNYAFDF